jgi:tRNA A-37 threonylcarbamoyl transferase component Bud32
MHPGPLMPRQFQIDPELGTQADVEGLIDFVDSSRARSSALKLHDEIDVYRTTWMGRDVVVKCYKHVGLIHSLRHTLKGSRARRGWRNGRRLMELGVPTPRPLAYVDEYRGPLLWRSLLVTTFEAGRRLDELLKDDRVAEGTKRRLVSQVLRRLDRLACHGVSHGDMKHTNILCQGSRIILTDLDGMRTSKLGWVRRFRTLRDISRFFRGLVPAEKAVPPRSDVLPTVNLEPALLREPAHFGAERVTSSPGARVWRLTLPSDPSIGRVYLKEYVTRSWLDRIKDLVRPSRARRAMRGAQWLAQAGLKTPRIVAAPALGHRCFLVTVEVADAHAAYEYFRAGRPAHASSTLRERRRLLRQLGHEIGRMHQAGIVHGDLRAGNILVRRGDPGWDFFFIDNERTRKWPWIPRRWRLKNLVQLNMLPNEITNTDRLRFFDAYMQHNPSVRLDCSGWARDVMATTHRRFRKRGWIE